MQTGSKVLEQQCASTHYDRSVLGRDELVLVIEGPETDFSKEVPSECPLENEQIDENAH